MLVFPLVFSFFFLSFFLSFLSLIDFFFFVSIFFSLLFFSPLLPSPLFSTLSSVSFLNQTGIHIFINVILFAFFYQAHSFSEVLSACSHSEERELFSCLDRYERRESCCSLARENTQCRNKCEDVFDSPLPTDNMGLDIEIYCSDERIQQCVYNYTTIMAPRHNPRDSLYCCERSTRPRCREVCRQTLTNLTSEGAIMNALEAGCDQPVPNDEMWKCFLLVSAGNEVSHPDVGPTNAGAIDGANLQCCLRAISSRCRDICVKLYTPSLSSKETWNEFDEHCRYQPAEEALLTCLADVEEPCKPGCSGMDYCAHFNNRPTDLFRSCSVRSDEGAAYDMQLWSEGLIRMPFMNIPVLNIAECESDMWKTIACTLQVKPCHRKTHTNMICKSDCIHILSRCIDQSRLAKGVDSVGLCNILSPFDDNAPCVSLNPFLDPSQHHSSLLEDITTPCHSDPCNNDTEVPHGVCRVNRKLCGHQEVCQHHTCSTGCRLGEASSFLVPIGSYVRLPDSGDNLDCYQSCVCGPTGQLEHCQPLQCERSEMCLISGQMKEHASHFHIDCNLCVCFGGTEICSKRQCLTNEMTIEERRRYTGLPCDCTDQFVPVCAKNGKTYPSACIAKCVGNFNDEQLEIGTCAVNSPCQSNPCSLGYRCVPKRRVCLSVNFADCPQYDCVIASNDCNMETYAPVCDTNHITHPNMCTLHSLGAELAYRGRCQVDCHSSIHQQVCGHNGETYSSECEAWNDRTTVDYYGPCQAVGTLTGEEDVEIQCTTVDCPEVVAPDLCIAVTPPGSCCPICAGQVRILFSEREVDRVVTASGSRSISLDSVLDGLRNEVAVAECDLFGYLSIEGDIIALIKPIVTNPTLIQIKACNTEAEKIAALINNRSPVISAYLHLSPLLAAASRNPQIIEPNSAHSIHQLSSFCTLIIVLRTIHELLFRVLR
ncbi:reversion-inducing cysteine-rich protein with Kazal motifs-like [Lytechinus pictus]|uniref:reversion-inducing cysteine-rich protein with Kazal motifs-like n=1 Tax=Lytechinus pictus TaxID=7653 RepID=UPI0030BA1141